MVPPVKCVVHSNTLDRVQKAENQVEIFECNQIVGGEPVSRASVNSTLPSEDFQQKDKVSMMSKMTLRTRVQLIINFLCGLIVKISRLIVKLINPINH